MRIPAGTAVVGLLLLAGCVQPSAPFYPIGICHVPRTNDLPVVRAAGFNLVSGPLKTDYVKAVRDHGLRLFASPLTTAGKSFNAAVARQAIATFDHNPALWAWSLADEPDLNLVPPEAVMQMHRFFELMTARKPTALTIYNAPAALHYAHITDLLLLDRYPIPWLPLANFGQHVRQARLALGPGKPLITVIQAFDWNTYPELMPGEAHLRPPTYPELRCMTYLALAQRANGLFYYAYDDGRWRIRDHPATWEALVQVVTEVNRCLPLFQGQHQWWPYRHRFQNWSHRFNAALESSITPAWLRVTRGNAHITKGDYLLLVNNSEVPQQYGITLPWPTRQPIPVLGETRQLIPQENWLEDEFPPLSVRIYGPLPSGAGP